MPTPTSRILLGLRSLTWANHLSSAGSKTLPKQQIIKEHRIDKYSERCQLIFVSLTACIKQSRKGVDEAKRELAILQYAFRININFFYMLGLCDTER